MILAQALQGLVAQVPGRWGARGCTGARGVTTCAFNRPSPSAPSSGRARPMHIQAPGRALQHRSQMFSRQAGVYNILHGNDKSDSLDSGEEQEEEEEEVEEGVYANPEVYDIAFGYRNFQEEVDFLWAITEERLQEEPMTALELGAGPAQHCIELAKRGLQVTALEKSNAMIEYAQKRAAEEKVQVNLIKGDMTNFDILQPGGGWDMVLILLGSLNHLLTNQEVIDCFKNAASVLSPSGTMVVELNHPQDLWDGQLMDELGDAWENENGEGGKTALVEWGREGDSFDPVTQILQRTVGMTLFDPEGEIELVTESIVPQRQFTAQDVDALARAAGLRVEVMYGDMNADIDIYHDEANRMVLVLVRDDKP